MDSQMNIKQLIKKEIKMQHNPKEYRAENGKLKVFATIALFAITLSTLQAQESVNTAGGNASGSGGSVSYSVGQVAYQTQSGTSGSVSEGAQQPYEISVLTGIAETEGINLSVSAYPNPTKDFLTLSVNKVDISDLMYQLYDMRGQLLKSEKITGNQTNIVMHNLPPATYFVKVYTAGRINPNGITPGDTGVHHGKSNEVGAMPLRVVKSFKIIKN